MAMRFYRFACQEADVEAITPQNSDSIYQELSFRPRRELIEKSGVESVDIYLSFLRRDPFSSHKAFLRGMYDLAQKSENRTISNKELIDHLKYKSSHSNLRFIELMGVVEVANRKVWVEGCDSISNFIQMRVNLNLMKEYWPDIEKWSIELPKKRIKEKLRQGRSYEILPQMLYILGKTSLDELTVTDLENIDSLNRSSWRKKGLTPPKSKTIDKWSKKLHDHAVQNSLKQ